MRILNKKQIVIYNAIFNPFHKIRKSHLPNKIKTNIMALFGHDISQHFLLPAKKYADQNICYYLQNIVLYVAYMGFIIENNDMPSDDFYKKTAELCLKFIEFFFDGQEASALKDANFREHLKETIILSVQNQINDKPTLESIIRKQLQILLSPLYTSSSNRITHSKQGISFSEKDLKAQPITGVNSSQAPATIFENELLERCKKMLNANGMNTDEIVLKKINTIKGSEFCNIYTPSGLYSRPDMLLGLFVVLTVICYCKTFVSLFTNPEETPYYLMGSFILTIFSYLFSSRHVKSFLKAAQDRCVRQTEELQKELEEILKIEVIDYSAEESSDDRNLPSLPIKSPENSDSDVLSNTSFSEVPVRIYIFSKPKNKKTENRKEEKSSLKFFQAINSSIEPLSITDFLDVSPDMQCRWIEGGKNVALLYDPHKEYEDDWVLSDLKGARLSRTYADTGFKSLGHIQILNSKEKVTVYELKQFHRGAGEARLLIPLVALKKKDGSTMSALDCRGALFLEKGLHQSKLSEYCFDPQEKQIIHRNRPSASLKR